MQLLTVGNMYPPHHQGGYELAWRSFVARAREAGHETIVLTSVHSEPGVPWPGDEPGVHRVLPWWWEEHAFPQRSWWRRRLIARRGAIAFDALAEHYRPEVVMWWSMGGLPLGLLGRARRHGLTSVGVVHDAWPAYGPRVDPSTRAVAVDPDVADVWSVNSDWLRDGLLRLPGWQSAGARVHVDPPGIDPARVPCVEPGPWRWRLLCLGRVEPRKGLADAVRALPLLPDEASLDVVGGGDDAHAVELRELAATLGVAERVRMTGPVEDVGAVYAAADAVLFPVTWDEPFGLVPLEAMSVGRPVVATATGGAREFLRDGHNAVVVAPGDPGGLARAVRRLGEDGALRRRLREGGSDTAARYTEDAFAAALLRRAAAASAAGRDDRPVGGADRRARA